MPAISLETMAWYSFYIIAALGLVLLTVHLLEVYTSQTQKSTSIISTLRLARFVQSRLFDLQNIRPQATEFQGPLLRSLPMRSRPSYDVSFEKQNIDSSPADMCATVSSHMHSIASSHPRNVYVGRSTFESPSILSLYAKHKHFTDTTYLGAFCSLDPSIGRILIRLHPEDIANVLETGWGRKVRGTDEVLIHMPRNEVEVQIVRECMDAALGWTCGGEVEEGEDIAEADRPVWLLPHISL